MQVPSPAYGATYRHATSTQSFDVWNEVPLVPQLTGMSCWAAAAAMIVGWRDGIVVEPEEVAKGVGYWQEYIDGLHPLDTATLAERWGLVVEPDRAWSVGALRDLLARVGPLWVGEASPGLHSVVVVGIHGDGTPHGTFLRINDPWPVGRGERYQLRYRELMLNFQAATDAVGLHAQVMHAGGRGRGASRQYRHDARSAVWITTPDRDAAIAPAPAGVLTAGRELIDTVRFDFNPLADHGGTGENLALVWNAIPRTAQAVDVVVHFHGYSADPPDRAMLERQVEIGALDIDGRGRPTLGLVPRGRKIAADELAAERRRGRRPNPRRYTFPGLAAGAGGGLELLLAQALDRFGRVRLGRGPGHTLPVARLIFSARGGGGAALNQLLRFHRVCRACDPTEVIVFDGIHGSPGRQGDGIVRWATHRIRLHRPSPVEASGDDNRAFGGLQIRYGPATRAGSIWIAKQIATPELSGDGNASVRSRIRIQPHEAPPEETARQEGPVRPNEPPGGHAGGNGRSAPVLRSPDLPLDPLISRAPIARQSGIEWQQYASSPRIADYYPICR